MILQIFLGFVVSPIYRIVKGVQTKDNNVLIAGIVIIFISPIFWIIDFITILLSNEISILA